MRRLLRRFIDAFHVLVVLCALGTGGGCVQRPPPPAPFTAPNARVSVQYLAGGILSSAPKQPVSDLPADALSVRVTLVSLERAPQSAVLQPLASRAMLVTTSRGGAAVIADPRITRGAKVVPPAQVRQFTDAVASGRFGRSARIAQPDLAVPAGATGEVDILDSVARADPLSDRPQTALLSIAAFQRLQDANGTRGSSLQIALIVRQSGTATLGDGGAFEEETVLLDPLPTDQPTGFAVVVPFTFTGHRSWGVAAVINISRGPAEPAFEQAVARAAAAARTAGGEARAAVATTAPSAGPSELAAAVALLADAERQRQALTFLADQTGATVCQDFALGADPKTLSSVCNRVRPQAASITANPRAMGWLLDGQTLTLLSELEDAGTLPPELATVLTIHAGEVGRHPATMQDVLKSAADQDSLIVRVTSENLLFLEDSSPASRVRAFEWLSARGVAPAGYDPLAPARQQRAALERALAPATQPVAREAGHE